MAKGDRTGMRGVASQIVNEFDISRKAANKKKIEQAISDWRKSGDLKVENGRVIESERAQIGMVELAEDLTNDIVIKDPVITDQYRELRDYLKGPMYLSKEDRARITDWSYYQRSGENMLRFTLNREAISVDSKYHDLLNSPHGYLFRDNEATNPADQVQQMNDVLGWLRQESQGRPYEYFYGRDGKEEMKDAITASIDVYVREELKRQAANRREK